ncbi:hypothetical protein F2Q69_00033265 [Brassica cretica]|uniref:Uncharacterized protein n=1 Tax=Brassica cretica TaxID=69181 RepID=A0A8S9SI12_BRACR|nr:hypothetical protein F2Q69_00033265 [Brassica cretica]
MNNKLELEFKILVEESDPSCVVGFKRTWEHVRSLSPESGITTMFMGFSDSEFDETGSFVLEKFPSVEIDWDAFSKLSES